MSADERYSQKWMVTAAVLTISSCSLPAMAGSFDDELEAAFKFGHDDARYGQLKSDLRLRYETVDEDDPSLQQARATTLRLRLGYLTPEAGSFQGYIEYEGNLALQDKYNSGDNGKSQYSKIVDPEASELNRFWVNYSGLPDTQIKAGRQRITLDDQRFIGAVAWRQMEQTFDAGMVQNNSIENLMIRVGYIGNVQTISSKRESINAPILNINYKLGDIGSLTGYGYWLDYKDAADFGKSNQTYGLRFTGARSPKENIKLSYAVEGGYQEAMGDNPESYSANRYLLNGGLEVSGIKVLLGYEELQGDGAGKRFITPLGTNHKFQGWADKFLTTPDDGVEDLYVQLTLPMLGSKAMFVYHDFRSSNGDDSYGDEFDFQLSKQFGKHYSLLAKYAYYNADQFSTDTQKLWLQIGAVF